MKVEKLEIKATIPTGQYANIQPSIEITDCEVKEGTDFAMGWVKEMFSKYSEKGALNEKDIVLVGEMKKSFNEGVEVLFEPIPHRYTHNAVELLSATNFTKKFYKEFDGAMIAGRSAKAWGVNEEDVLKMWKESGELTAEFGTLVHKALEFWVKYRELGAIIQAKKGLPENYAIPKHPILREIVKGFIAIEEATGFMGQVVPEALVTSIKKGYCGHIDRLLVTSWENKTCRIQDYKINIGSDEAKQELKASAPFDVLPANKLTKYQIQMSFYANLLQDSGWTIEGLDAFVYENEWKWFAMNVLSVV